MSAVEDPAVTRYLALRQSLTVAVDALQAERVAQILPRARLTHQLGLLDRRMAPLERQRAAAMSSLMDVDPWVLGPWAIDPRPRERWRSATIHLYNRLVTDCWSRIGWLRVGLWSPKPMWFLQVRGENVALGSPPDAFDRTLWGPTYYDDLDVRLEEASELLRQRGYVLLPKGLVLDAV